MKMSEETIEERQRRLARERQRRRRERQSSSEAAAARAADTLRRRVRLSQENEYEREIRRKRDRERIALSRRNSSREETEERRRIERERIAERRNNESDEAALLRRKKHAIHMKRLRAGISTTKKNASATVSCVNSMIRHDENGNQKAMTHSVQPSLPPGTQMQVQHHLQVAAPLPASSQPSPRQVQMAAIPVQVEVAKPKPVEKLQPTKKRLLAIASHQRDVMSSLASLWKSGKLCDAGISNGSSTVKVHKLVLSAVCPKLLLVSNMDKISHKFLQVNFPETVSKEALNAFAEYMYNGILDLDLDILEQLKIIAKRLDMEEFDKLCDSHLPNQTHLSASAAASFTNVPLIQTTMTIPAMTLSLASFGSTVSTSMQSAQSINTPVIDFKQEISEYELAQVKKKPVAIFSQEAKVASLAPNKSGNFTGLVISPSIKTEPIWPEDDKYGHCYSSSSNQTFTSTTSSSSSSTIAKSTEFAIPFSEATDVKSTRLKATDLSPASGIVETVRSQSNSMNEDSSKPLSQLSSVNLSNNNDTVYPVRLFSARGDNLPLLKTHSSDAMTVNSFIQSEKT